MTGAPVSNLRLVAAFAIVALVWGSTWLVIKDQVSAVPATWTVSFRFALASIAMAALALLRGESLRLPAPALRLAALIGIAQFTCNFQLVYQAERYLTSGIVSVLYALLMVPNALAAWVFLRQPVSRRFLCGSTIAIGGIALLLLHEYRLAPPEGSILLGVALAFGGLAFASVANVLQATPAAREVPLVPMLTWAMIFGAGADVVLALAVDGAPAFDPRPQYWAGLVYLAVIGSVLTFPLYFLLIRELGAGRAAYNGVVVPIIAMALSTLFEGYHWTWLAAAGTVIAMVGLLIALSGRQQRA